MAKTLAEVLKQSGLTDEQIAAIDAKALAAGDSYIGNVEKTASELAAKAEADKKLAEEQAAAAKAAQDAAELNKRSVDEFWKETYNPSMAAWEAERVRLAKAASDAQAEAAYYKTQRTTYLDTLGIKPEDAPVFTPVTPTQVDPPKTPGTPTFSEDSINQKIGSGLSNSVWALQEYQRLTGQFLPDPIDKLAQEATYQKLDFRDYVARKYDFSGKQQAIQAKAQQAHDDEIAKKAAEAKEAEWQEKLKAREAEFAATERQRAEQFSNNPDTKLPPGSAKFSDLRREQAAGSRPDPTKMSPQERRKLSLENIHKAIEERQTAVA